MDFRLDPEQQALADTAARWCAKEFDAAARSARLHAGTDAQRVAWRRFAELGWHGAGLSEADGGFGGGAVENAILMEAFGRALVIEPFLASSVHALQTLVALPAGALREELIASAVGGDCILALAHAGDAAAPLIHARASADGWVLDGSAQLVWGAPLADRLLVPAHTGEGLALFLLGADEAGPALIPYRTLDNMAVADLALAGTPAQLLCDGSAETAAALEHGLAQALVALCAEAVGAMDAAIAITVDYVRTRRQFGSTLNGFQAVQHRLADMLVEAELARSILYQGMAACESPGPARARALAAMKAVVAGAALFVGRGAVQLHGGMGITEDCIISHYYRRLFVIAAQFGGESAQLARMAGIAGGFWDGQVPGLPLPAAGRNAG